MTVISTTENRRKSFFYIFTILFMFRIDFFTLTSIMFGRGGTYRLLQAAMYVVLLVLMSLSLGLLINNIRRLKKDIAFLYVLFAALTGISCFIDSNVVSLIEAQGLLHSIFISAMSGYALYRFIDDYDLFLKVFIKISYLVIIYATLIVLTSSIGSAYMGFSYGILIFVLIALYDGLFAGNKVSLLFGFLGTIVNVMGGTRGSLLSIVTLILAFFLITKKWKRALGLIIVVGLFLLEYNNILHALVYVADSFGIDSRILSALQGVNMTDITYDNGRDMITAVCLRLIKDNPFGLGVLRDRVALNENVWWFSTNGYAHNIFLELLLQFGVFFGTVIIICGIACLMKFIRAFDSKDSAMAVGLVSLCYCMLLLVSRSYLTSFVFWAFWAIYKNLKTRRMIK